MQHMKVAQTVILATPPGSNSPLAGQLEVISLDEYADDQRGHQHNFGACIESWEKSKGDEKLTFILMRYALMVSVEGFDPIAVYAAFNRIKEFHDLASVGEANLAGGVLQNG